MPSITPPLCTKNPLESVASARGGAPKNGKLPPKLYTEEITRVLLHQLKAIKQNAEGPRKFNELIQTIAANAPELSDHRMNQFQVFEKAVKEIDPELSKYSPTEQSDVLKSLYEGVPPIVRPEHARFFKDLSNRTACHYGFCFFNFQTCFQIEKFLKKINSTGIVEVGFGSGMLGRLIYNSLIPYHGHELESTIGKYGFDNYLPEGSFTIHSDPNDRQYLIDAANQGKTLFLAFAESEEVHENMVARNSIEIYYNACRAAGRQASIILITESCADGNECQDFLRKNFKRGKKLSIFGYRDGNDTTLLLYKSK